MSKFLDNNISERGENRYNNLMGQVKQVFSSDFNNLNIKTAEKYYTAVSTFTKYIGEYTSINKIQNVNSKNIYDFKEKMKELGMSNSTFKSYMSGIRNFFDIGKQTWDKCKTVVPTNNKLGLEQRVVGCVERAWTHEEIKAAKDLAVNLNRKDVYHAINLASNFGLRLDGICSLTNTQINKALDTGLLTVKEKGGKVRDIPITNVQQKQALLELKMWGLEQKNWKDHVFCSNNKNIRDVKQSIQNFIYNNRDKFSNLDRIKSWEAKENYKKTDVVEKGNLTMHGLRHTFAKQQYYNFIQKGYTEKEAKLEVSRLLGHNRGEVTNIYLAKS